MSRPEPTLGNPKNTIEILQKYKFVFQKKFGQNFLIDEHVLEKIIQAAGVGDKILTAATLVPAIAYSVTFLIFAFWYPLNKKKLEKLHEDLKEVRKEEFEEIEEIEQKANA